MTIIHCLVPLDPWTFSRVFPGHCTDCPLSPWFKSRESIWQRSRESREMVQGILGVQGIPGLPTAHQPISHLRNHDEYQISAASWQNQKCGCAPSEDSDQSGHLPSLIRVLAVRMKKAWVLSYPLSAQRRLWSDWADAQADLSLRWAHTHFVGFVMSQLI